MSALQDLAPRDLLDRARATKNAVLRAEAEKLLIVAAWADAHPRLDDHGRPEPIPRPSQDALAAHFAGMDEHEELDAPAWAGLPPVAWSAAAALGTALDLSTTGAQALLRDTLVLRHRLPRTWLRAINAEVPAWRARRIALAVAGAPDDVCEAIDKQLAPRAHAVGIVALDQVSQVAMARLHPEEVEMASLQRLQRMHVTMHLDRVSFDGLSEMTAQAEYADLHRLDQTLTALAQRLHEVDPAVHASDPLPYRRARALRWLADPAAAATLLAAAPTHGADEGDRSTLITPPKRKVDLVVHLTPDAFTGRDPVALISHRLGSTTHAALTDVVAAWINHPGTTVTVTPVVDLNQTRDELDADRDVDGDHDSYRPSTATKRAVLLRDPTCRFPWCTRPAAGCDFDHVTPWPHGPTHPDNLVPLCRHHHRLKTLAGYESRVVVPGTTAWTTPYGDTFLVDADGTHRLPAARTGAPIPVGV